MIYRIKISKTAESRIEERVDFLVAESGTRLSADRWLESLLAAIHSLRTLPRRAVPYPLSGVPGLRRLLVHDHWVYFDVNEAARSVDILAIRHTRQREPETLFDL